MRKRAALFAFRFVMACWQSAVLVGLTVGHAEDPSRAAHPNDPWWWQFLFFTVWNYMLQTVFWACAATASAAALCSAGGPSAGLRCAMHSLLSVCLPMALLVSIVLWSILFPVTLAHHKPSIDLNFYSYNMHALNTLMLLCEACVDRLLLQRAALGLLVAWVLLYAAAAFVQHAFTDWWPYFFLALDTWAALGWWAALGGVTLGVYLLVLCLSACKARRQPRLVEGGAESLAELRAAFAPPS